jgi:hypothetical protein
MGDRDRGLASDFDPRLPMDEISRLTGLGLSRGAHNRHRALTRVPGDRSLEYRASAAECLRLAGNATEPGARAALMLMAQRWMVLAGATSGALQGDALLPDDVNDRQTDEP